MSRNGRQKKVDKNRPKATIEDKRKYIEAWTNMMVEIWRDRITRLDVIDTTALYHRIDGNFSMNDSLTTIRHRFLEYGIFQDCGVGRGFKAGNGGNLEIFDNDYREEHGLNRARSWNGPKSHGHTSGKPRKPREWFSRPYYASIMVLKDQMAYMYAEEFTGLVAEAIEFNENYRGTSLRNKLWGTRPRRRR